MFNFLLNTLLQLALFGAALAAPTTQGHHGPQNWHYGLGGGIVGFIVLVLDIIVWSASCSRYDLCTDMLIYHSRGLAIEPASSQ